MIYAYAIEPELASAWGSLQEFRFFGRAFGLGTPRALLELPKFTHWRSAVLKAATAKSIPQMDLTRLQALFQIFDTCRCRRTEFLFDGNLPWLANAESAHTKRFCEAILAVTNPQNHPAILLPQALGAGSHQLWDKPTAATPFRTPESLSAAISAMLWNCSAIRLVDPHFIPETRFTRVLEAVLRIVSNRTDADSVSIEVHCRADKCSLDYFKTSASNFLPRVPPKIVVKFFRWSEKAGGQKLHNRYILSDLGGVHVGEGLDTGAPHETDDLNLMTADQFTLRWEQYRDGSTAFNLVDSPPPLVGQPSSPASPITP